MWIEKIDETKKELSIAIPLTKGTEKTRIKKRSFFNEYGFPVATRQEAFSQSCYVEWQIGYDIVTAEADKLEKTTLKNIIFIGANSKEKTLYELSEYIYYFYKWNIVKKQDLTDIQVFLKNLSGKDFIDQNPELAIERSHPVLKSFNNIEYQWTQVKYPVLIHKFGKYEILTEIIIKEKQYAIGVQPMLYFCFPITELNSKNQLLGRIAEPKETASFVINKYNIEIFMLMLKMFSTLSENHNKDIKTIIEKIMV
ncbi:restriction endonuclease [Spirochaetia bacterium]|nr:restriction endonuclease [Spirochaetia bacterium]